MLLNLSMINPETRRQVTLGPGMSIVWRAEDSMFWVFYHEGARTVQLLWHTPRSTHEEVSLPSCRSIKGFEDFVVILGAFLGLTYHKIDNDLAPGLYGFTFQTRDHHL